MNLVAGWAIGVLGHATSFNKIYFLITRVIVLLA
jgi:hypothetical protein